MIVLMFPDGSVAQLSDADAERLCGVLWETAEQKRTASVAVAIHEALRRHVSLRMPIDVPPATLDRVDAALLGLQ